MKTVVRELPPGITRWASAKRRAGGGAGRAPPPPPAQRGRAAGRAAVAAAARRAHLDCVAFGQVEALVLAPVRRAVLAPAEVHGDVVRRAGAAAQEAGGPEAAVVHHERQRGLAAPEPQPVVHAEAAPRRASAARALAERVLLEEERVALLQHLDRLGLGDADRGAAVREPVALAAPAGAAAAEEVHDVVPFLERVVPPHREIAARARRR